MNDFFNDHQKQNLREGKVVIKAICKYIWMISHYIFYKNSKMGLMNKWLLYCNWLNQFVKLE